MPATLTAKRSLHVSIFSVFHPATFFCHCDGDGFVLAVLDVVTLEEPYLSLSLFGEPFFASDSQNNALQIINMNIVQKIERLAGALRVFSLASTSIYF